MTGWPEALWIDKIFQLGAPPDYYWLWFFRTITQLGSPLVFVILASISFIFLWWRRKRLQALFTCIAVTSGWLLNDLFKELWMRPRPPGEAFTYATGYSFPSGHAMVSMAFYGFLAYVVLSQGGEKGKVGAAALGLLVFLIGISRIYLNVHYPSDVIGGWLLGFLVLWANIYGLKLLQRKYC